MAEDLSIPQEANNQGTLAERQVALATAWADIYRYAPSDIRVTSAEIVLRNPAVYIENINLPSLPEELQDRWRKLLTFSKSLTAIAATEPISDDAKINGLHDVQQLVFTDRVNPDFRGSVGDLMRASSALFAESTKHIAGDTHYYQGNIEGGEAWLLRHQQYVGSN